MNVAEIETELAPAKLRSEGFSNVRRVIVQPGEDSTGDDALFVILLLDNKVKDAEMEWIKIEPLISKVRRQAQEFTRYALYPYIRVLREKDYLKASKA